MQIELEVWQTVRILDYANKKYLALPGSAFLEVTDRKLKLRVGSFFSRPHSLVSSKTWFQVDICLEFETYSEPVSHTVDHFKFVMPFYSEVDLAHTSCSLNYDSQFIRRIHDSSFGN